MKKQLFCMILGIIIGFTQTVKADGLPANPWGKATNSQTNASQIKTTHHSQTPPSGSQNIQAQNSNLKANPWTAKTLAHTQKHKATRPVVNENKFSTPKFSRSRKVHHVHYVSGGMGHSISPHRIVSRSDLNGGHSFSDGSTDSGFMSIFNGISSPSTPSISEPSVSNADNFLPDTEQIKRNTTQKFNNITNSVRQSVKNAQSYVEQESGVKLNEIFK